MDAEIRKPPTFLKMEKRSKGEVVEKSAKFVNQKVLRNKKTKEEKKKRHTWASRFFYRFFGLEGEMVPWRE